MRKGRGGDSGGRGRGQKGGRGRRKGKNKNVHQIAYFFYSPIHLRLHVLCTLRFATVGVNSTDTMGGRTTDFHL